MPNWIYIYKGHIRSSIKTIFISSIGLIFALAIITSTLVYVDATRALIYTDFIQQNTKNNHYGNDYSFTVYFRNSSSTLESIQSTLNQTILQRIHSLNLDSKISSIWLIAHIEGLQFTINSTNSFDNNIINTFTIYVPVFEITNQVRPELEKLNSESGNGTLPQIGNNNQAYFVYYNPSGQSSTTQPQIYSINNSLDVFNTYQTTSKPYSVNEQYYHINISGYSLLKSFNYALYPYLSKFLSGYSFSALFVNNLTTFFHMLNTPLNTIPGISSTSLAVYIYGGISINYSALNAYDANTDLNSFERLQVQLQDDFSTVANNLQLEDSHVGIDFFSQGILQSAASVAAGILGQLLIYALPIILVTLFVANYSFGLIHRNVLRHIGTYKTRGATNTLILFMQIIDLIFIVLIAIAGGVVLGLPISSLILHTDSFLSFNGLPNAVLQFDLENLLQILVFSGLILGFVIQFLRIIKLSIIPVSETESPTEQTEPFWKRHYLDLLLFFSGMTGFMVLWFLPTNNATFLGPFIVIFYPTIVILPIGAILFFSRIFPLVLNKISIPFWQYSGGLFAFSMKNVTRHRQASIRAVMLIGILLAFFIPFLTIPFSNTVWTQKTLAYDLGAEGVATLPNTGNTYFYNATLVNILKTNFSQYFQGITPYLELSFPDYSGSTNNAVSYGFGNSFLAINTTTFLSAADIPVDLNTRNSLQTDMHVLGENNSIPDVIIQKNFLQFHDTTIGKTITLLDARQKSYQFNIIDTFSRWPNLFRNYIYDGQYIFGVINIAPFISNNYTFQNSPYTLVASGIYLSFKSGVNQTFVAQMLKNKFSLSTTLLSQQIYESTHQITTIVMIGQINANIIVSIIIGGTILLMFAWLQLIERRKEIFTERTLGMKMYQLAFLFLAESLILLGSGIVIGIFMGGELSEIFSIFLTFGASALPSSVIPYVTYYPLNLIGESLITLIILAIIGALIPALIVTRLDITNSFAGEK